MNRPTTITLLAVWTLATFTAGAGAVAIEQSSSDRSEAPAAAEPAPGPAEPSTEAPASGNVQFSGGVGSVELVGDFDAEVLFGATFVAEENSSNDGAEIEGVVVGDQLASIVWDGGRPLVISGAGGFSFYGVPVRLVDGLVRADVGESDARLGPGTYVVDTPVAVGRAGLAEPRDAVEFVVAATDTPSVQLSGRVALTLPLVPIEISGPGGLVLEGTFTSFDDGTEQVFNRIVVEESDDYLISLAPFAGGWVVDGRVPSGAVVG